MNKQKYHILIVPSFGSSRKIVREAKVIVPCVVYDVYCNGEFLKHCVSEDMLDNCLNTQKHLVPRSLELDIVVDNTNINSLKF